MTATPIIRVTDDSSPAEVAAAIAVLRDRAKSLLWNDPRRAAIDAEVDALLDVVR